MLVTGGTVFAGRELVEADVIVRDGIVSGITGGRSSMPQVDAISHDEVVVDASGCIVAPGFIDLHFHGCAGVDLCDATPEALHFMASYQASRGVTAICPATMTYPEERLEAVMRHAASFVPLRGESALVGINMEGPFISPNRAGAQNPAFIQPCDAGMVKRLQQAAAGLIKLVDMAPETPGGLAFIRELAGIACVSLAHTCADYECAAAAFEAGARHVTHLFDAMPPLHHRNPGPIGAAADRQDVTVELIADGVHVHPSMVRLAFSLFGDERVVLISDSMRACGMGDGTFDFGGQAVQVRGARAMLADGSIAGSVTDLASCVRIAVCEMGIPLESALLAATANPARVLGIDAQRGSIALGKVADLVLLDDDLRIQGVVLRGELIGQGGNMANM